MFSVHTTPVEFENDGFNPKTHQMFSVHTTPEKFEDATITGHHFGIFLRRTLIAKSHDHREFNVFEKIAFQNVSRPH